MWVKITKILAYEKHLATANLTVHFPFAREPLTTNKIPRMDWDPLVSTNAASSTFKVVTVCELFQLGPIRF